MFTYSRGRWYIFLCWLFVVCLFFCATSESVSENLWFLNVLSLQLSIRGLLSELICWVFMCQKNKFAFLKQNKYLFFFGGPGTAFWFQSSFSEGQQWFQSGPPIHAQSETHWHETYDPSVYAYTISGLWTHTYRHTIRFATQVLWHNLGPFGQNKCLL